MYASPPVCQLVVASPRNFVSTSSSPFGCRNSQRLTFHAATASCPPRDAPPLPLDAPPPHASQLAVSLLSPMRRRRCQRCAGIFTVIVIAIVALGNCHPRRSSSSSAATSTSVAIIVVVSRWAVAIVVDFVTRCAVAIIGDVTVRRTFVIIDEGDGNRIIMPLKVKYTHTNHKFTNGRTHRAYSISVLVRTPSPPVRRHHQIAASGRDP